MKYGLEFSQKNTAWVRGLAAVGLVCIHTIEEGIFETNQILNIIGKCGFLCVAVFFFLSGYGLIFNIENRPDYIKGFIGKKIVRLLLPVYISEVFYAFYYVYSGSKAVVGYDILVFWNYVRYSWFVLSIGIIYLIFFTVYSFTNNRRLGFWSFQISICVAIVVCRAIDISDIYYKCVPAFIVGCFFAHYYKYIKLLINKHYIGSILAGGGITIILVTLAQYSDAIVKSGVYSVLLCVVIILVSHKFMVSSRVTDRLADVSYELYLLHGLAVLICSGIHNICVLVIVLAVAMIMALAVSFVDNKLINYIQKIFLRG